MNYLFVCILIWILCGFACYGFLNNDLYNKGVKHHRLFAGIVSLFGPAALPVTVGVLNKINVKFRL
jgi:hypothetical protein